MHRHGHHGVALLGYAPTIPLFGPEHRWLALLGLPVVLFASRLPDIDQRVPIVPHRGPTHTVWFAVLLGLGTWTVFRAALPGSALLVQLGIPGTIAFGVISHLAADAFTSTGVRPFWPFWDRLIALGVCRASDPVANWLLLLGGLVAMALVLTGYSIPLQVDLQLPALAMG